MELSERDLGLDLLMTQKHLMATYELGVRESADPKLRSALSEVLLDQARLQHDLFQAANTRGWYKTQVAGAHQIREAVEAWQARLEKASDTEQGQ